MAASASWRDPAASRLRAARPPAPRGACARIAPGRSRSRPSRAACSGGSSRRAHGCGAPGSVAAMSRRRCMPSHEIASAARSAASRARRQVRPAPDDGQHAAAVRAVAAAGPPDGRRHGTRGRRRTRPRRCPRSAARASACPDSPPRRARCRPWHPAAPAAGRRPAPARRARHVATRPRARGPSAAARRGRITCASGSPSLALHSRSTGPSVGEHQPGVEEPDERAPAARQLGQDRAVDGREDLLDGRRRERRGAASRRPSRRCSGPGRRRTAACGRATPAAPPPRGRRRSRSRSPRGPTAAPPRSAPARGRGPRGRRRRGPAPAPASSYTATPLPAARPSCFSTTPLPAAPSSAT